MKSFKIFIVVGLLVFFGGAYLLENSYGSITKQEVLTIPPGDAYYYYLKTQGSLQGKFYGSFTVSSGNVDVYILNEQQYQTYSINLLPTVYFYHELNVSSGSFNVDLPNPDTYYFVTNHGLGFESTEQSVTVNYYFSGTNYLYLIGGVLALVAGCIFLVVGYVMKKKTKTLDSNVPQQITDVQIFDNQQKPPQ